MRHQERRRAGRRTVAGALVVALATAAVGLATVGGAAATAPDPVFAQPPAGFEAQAPGTLLRSRPVTVKGLGIPLPFKAWQLLTRSTDTKGNPVAVVSTLMVPLTPYLLGARPLLSYQVAIDGLGDRCMPSYSLQTGSTAGNTQPELLTMTTALAQGWAVVTTDFEGPHNAYGAGRMAGHAVLDGVRGALRLGGTGLAGARTPVGLMGYSGGGQATSWAAELQPTYAPELAVKGIASGGTPADLALILRHLDGSLFSGLMLGAVFGAGREYPELDLDTLLNPAGKALREEMADMCVNDMVISHPLQRLGSFTTVADPLSLPVAQSVIADASLGHATPRAPVYLYHAILDELIPIAAADGLKATWCAGGAKVLYNRSLLGEHVAYAATGAPGAILYLAGRFANLPAPSNC